MNIQSMNDTDHEAVLRFVDNDRDRDRNRFRPEVLRLPLPMHLETPSGPLQPSFLPLQLFSQLRTDRFLEFR